MKKFLIYALIIITFASAVVLLLLPDEEFVPPKNIVFMLFDTMRADHLSAYGYERETSPAMAEVAADGVVFERTFSQTGWTLPSVASYFTGTYPVVHSARDMKASLSRSFITLAEYMGYCGYLSVGASNNPLVSRDREMHRGFRRWVDKVRDPALTNYGLSWLNVDDINYYRMWQDNYLSNYTFRDLYPNLKEKGERYELGYIDREAYKTSAAKLGPGGDVILSVSRKRLEAGSYHWGLSLRRLAGSSSVRIKLFNPAGGDKSVLAEEIINLTEEWKQYYFELNSGEPVEKILMYLSFTGGGENTEVAVDDVFILKRKKRDPGEKRFIYLHYINPHEPHVLPVDVKEKYSALFNDYPWKKEFISRTKGDEHDLINTKFILHRHRIDSWIKLADEIGIQLNSYDREILYMDSQVRQVTDYLKATGQYEDTMIILTADHGDEFLDHGHISHMLSLYNELIRIPLIISYPRSFPSGVRVSENTASIDVFRTFIDLLPEVPELREKSSRQVLGKSLAPLISGKDKYEDRLIFSSDYMTSQTAVIYGDWKLIQRFSRCSTKNSLFNIRDDFHERNDMATAKPEMVRKLVKAIENYEAAAEAYKAKWVDKIPGQKTDRASNKKLQNDLMDLGYIDAAKTVFDLSRDFEDAYCILTQERLSILLALKIINAVIF